MIRSAMLVGLGLGLGCSSPDVTGMDLASPPDDAGVLLDGAPDMARPSLVSPAEAVDTDPAPGVVHVKLVAAPLRFEVAGAEIDGFAYNGQVPGPTLRARRGDRLVVDFENHLPDETTIHWHGLHVPYAMDGVTWQRAPIAPGQGFRYEFPLTQAGTFWYHPHFDSQHQLDRGLYGVLIVEAPDDPPVDAELVLVFDAFEEEEGAEGPDGGRAADGGSGHGGGGGQHGAEPHRIWTVNRLHQPVATMNSGQVVRVRMVNVSTGGYLDLRQPGMLQIASDQGLLAALRQPQGLLLASGDRAELQWLAGPPGFVVAHAPYSAHGGAGSGGGGSHGGADGGAEGAPAELFAVTVNGSLPPPRGPLWHFSGRKPTADPPYTDIVYVLQGDGDRWYINGEVFPDVTVESLAFGADAVIEVRNLSATEHPFHLHGHAFEVLSTSGKPVADYSLEDTVNVPMFGTVRLLLHADNPGDWMTHCHILSHAEGGMMTVLRVRDP